jgi:hypothetical protein
VLAWRALFSISPSSVLQLAERAANASTSLLPLNTSALMQEPNMKSISLSFWLFSPPVDSYSGCILAELSANYNLNADTFVLVFNGNSGAGCGIGGFRVAQFSTGYSIFCTQARVDGGWHHITVVMDRSLTTAAEQTRIYIDGALAAKTQVGPNNQVHTNSFGVFPLHIGARLSGVGQYTGQLSNLQIYTSALTSSDVFRLFSSGMSSVASTLQPDGSYAPCPLAGWWPLYGSLEDKSGRNATLQTAVPLSTAGVDPMQLQFVPLSVASLPITLQYRPHAISPTVSSLLQLGASSGTCDLSVSCVDARLNSLETISGTSSLTATVAAMRDLTGGSTLVSTISRLSTNSSILQASDTAQSAIIFALQAANSSMQAGMSSLFNNAALTNPFFNVPSTVVKFTAQSIINTATSLLPLSTSAQMNRTAAMALTISFWMFVPTVASFVPQLLFELSADMNSNDRSFFLSFDDNSGSTNCPTGSVRAVQGSATPSQQSSVCTSARVDHGWHHITVVMDRTLTTVVDQTRIYVDGGLADTVTTASMSFIHTTSFGSYPLFIGGRKNGTTYQFTGQLSNIQLYTSALSASDVFRLCSSGLSPLASTLQPDGSYARALLSGWWPLSGSLEDRSGRNATLQTAVSRSTAGVDQSQVQYIQCPPFFAASLNLFFEQ